MNWTSFVQIIILLAIACHQQIDGFYFVWNAVGHWIYFPFDEKSLEYLWSEFELLAWLSWANQFEMLFKKWK